VERKDGRMKAITIIQPWATLIALGEKRFETRSWTTKHQGPLAIHAGKKIEKKLCRIEPFRSILAAHGFDEHNLPTGSIIATARLTGCFKVNENHGTAAFLDTGLHISVRGNEYFFGDFSAGRFAWELTDVKRIDPTPAKGQQGLWNWAEER
jgi:hypothetical protein